MQPARLKQKALRRSQCTNTKHLHRAVLNNYPFIDRSAADLKDKYRNVTKRAPHFRPARLTLLLLALELALQVSVGRPGPGQCLLALAPQLADGGVLVELLLHQP